MCVISPYPSVLQEGRFAGRSTDPQDQDHPDQPQCQESGKRCSHLPFLFLAIVSPARSTPSFVEGSWLVRLDSNVMGVV